MNFVPYITIVFTAHTFSFINKSYWFIILAPRCFFCFVCRVNRCRYLLMICIIFIWRFIESIPHNCRICHLCGYKFVWNIRIIHIFVFSFDIIDIIFFLFNKFIISYRGYVINLEIRFFSVFGQSIFQSIIGTRSKFF